MAKVLKRKSSTIYEELQLLIDLLFFMTKVVYLNQAFLWYLYGILAQGEKYYTSLSLLKMICYNKKNFIFDRMELYLYAFTTNAILYRQMCLAFVV